MTFKLIFKTTLVGIRDERCSTVGPNVNGTNVKNDSWCCEIESYIVNTIQTKTDVVQTVQKLFFFAEFCRSFRFPLRHMRRPLYIIVFLKLQAIVSVVISELPTVMLAHVQRSV